jgi:protein-disulfide isomerase
MHDKLFETQTVWSTNPNAEAFFLSLASQLGLNGSQFQQSMRSAETRDRVLADVARGRDANIGGTPTFFVNGQMVQGSPGVDELAQLIESSLKSATK